MYNNKEIISALKKASAYLPTLESITEEVACFLKEIYLLPSSCEHPDQKEVSACLKEQIKILRRKTRLRKKELSLDLLNKNLKSLDREFNICKKYFRSQKPSLKPNKITNKRKKHKKKFNKNKKRLQEILFHKTYIKKLMILLKQQQNFKAIDSLRKFKKKIKLFAKNTKEVSVDDLENYQLELIDIAKKTYGDTRWKIFTAIGRFDGVRDICEGDKNPSIFVKKDKPVDSEEIFVYYHIEEIVNKLIKNLKNKKIDAEGYYSEQLMERYLKEAAEDYFDKKNFSNDTRDKIYSDFRFIESLNRAALKHIENEKIRMAWEHLKQKGKEIVNYFWNIRFSTKVFLTVGFVWVAGGAIVNAATKAAHGIVNTVDTIASAFTLPGANAQEFDLNDDFFSFDEIEFPHEDDFIFYNRVNEDNSTTLIVSYNGTEPEPTEIWPYEPDKYVSATAHKLFSAKFGDVKHVRLYDEVHCGMHILIDENSDAKQGVIHRCMLFLAQTRQEFLVTEQPGGVQREAIRNSILFLILHINVNGELLPLQRTTSFHQAMRKRKNHLDIILPVPRVWSELKYYKEDYHLSGIITDPKIIAEIQKNMAESSDKACDPRCFSPIMRKSGECGKPCVLDEHIENTSPKIYRLNPRRDSYQDARFHLYLTVTDPARYNEHDKEKLTSSRVWELIFGFKKEKSPIEKGQRRKWGTDVHPLHQHPFQPMPRDKSPMYPGYEFTDPFPFGKNAWYIESKNGQLPLVGAVPLTNKNGTEQHGGLVYTFVPDKNHDDYYGNGNSTEVNITKTNTTETNTTNIEENVIEGTYVASYITIKGNNVKGWSSKINGMLSRKDKDSEVFPLIPSQEGLIKEHQVFLNDNEEKKIEMVFHRDDYIETSTFPIINKTIFSPTSEEKWPFEVEEVSFLRYGGKTYALIKTDNNLYLIKDGELITKVNHAGCNVTGHPYLNYIAHEKMYNYKLFGIYFCEEQTGLWTRKIDIKTGKLHKALPIEFVGGSEKGLNITHAPAAITGARRIYYEKRPEVPVEYHKVTEELVLYCVDKKEGDHYFFRILQYLDDDVDDLGLVKQDDNTWAIIFFIISGVICFVSVTYSCVKHALCKRKENEKAEKKVRSRFFPFVLPVPKNVSPSSSSPSPSSDSSKYDTSSKTECSCSSFSETSTSHNESSEPSDKSSKQSDESSWPSDESSCPSDYGNSSKQSDESSWPSDESSWPSATDTSYTDTSDTENNKGNRRDDRGSYSSSVFFTSSDSTAKNPLQENEQKPGFLKKIFSWFF